jgi:hypothetical protein
MIWRIITPTKIIIGEIAPNVNWPKSQSFVHVNEQGALSSALTEQFLPARSAVLVDYWQKTAEKWRFAEVNFSSANNNQKPYWLNKFWYNHYQKVHLSLHNPNDPTP